MQTTLNISNDMTDEVIEQTRLLLLDDDPDYLDLIIRQIKRDAQVDFATDRANNIQTAVERCLVNEYDCVIVDFHLPDGYGTDIVKRLREIESEETPGTRHIPPIIVVSGEGDLQAATLAIRAGATDFIAKRDVTGAALRRAVGHAVDKSRLSLSLEKRNVELESKRREVLEFYHTLSHEVKTPLASAREFVALVRDGAAGAVSDDQSELLSLAIESCDQIRHQFMDLLEITRLDSQKFTLQRQCEPLVSIIKRSTAGVAQLARDRNIELSARGEYNDLHVFCDAQRIVQVLSNLLSNAIKFTRPGGWVHLTVGIDGSSVLLEVVDNGCGIRRCDQAAVFDRLHQIDNSDAQLDNSGLGLGLNISRDILLHHDTQLNLKSEWEVGSSFSFSLPITDATDPSKTT